MLNTIKLIVILLFTIVFFDTATYYLIPDKMAAKFPDYKVAHVTSFDIFGGYRYYPNNYFVPDIERGFDIGTNRKNKHYIRDFHKPFEYDIWSNSLGCFDIEHNDLSNYIYLAGDSYTWGFSPFDKKFGTLLQSGLSKSIVKCGVTHTGQRHQLSKAKQIISKIGAPPELIIVVWSQNDIANDYAHPHTTVLDGWQVNNVFLDDKNNLIKLDDSTIQNMLHEKYNKNNKDNTQSVGQIIKNFLRRYSLSSHIIYALLNILRPDRKALNKTIPHKDPISTLKNIYNISDYRTLSEIYPYNDLFSVKNKQAILDFKEYSNEIKSKLLLVLDSKTPTHLSEIHDFLNRNDITYLDLGSYEEYRAPDLHWPLDIHWNTEGNRVVAEILMKYIKNNPQNDI